MAVPQILRVALNATQSLGTIKNLVSGFAGVRKGAESATSAISEMANPLGQIKGLLVGLATTATIKNLVDTSDVYTEMGNKIRGVVKDQQEYITTQNKLFEAANRSRTSLGATVDLFSKLAPSMQGLGKTNDDALRLTETIQKLGKIGGMPKQAIEAGIYQFGQAMSSGVLQGDELRSIRENMPALARAIADGMGVPIGKLKELGSEGKLTSEAVVKALEKVGNKNDEVFGKIPQTFGEAMEYAKNHWVRFVGEMSKESGLVEYFSLVTKKIAEMMFGVGSDSKQMAKNIGDFIIDVFERLVIGAAKIIDILSPVFIFVKNSLLEFDKMWTGLPSWAQDGGLAGAIIFGKDFVVKAGMAATATNWILNKFDTSLGEVLGNAKDSLGDATKNQRGLFGALLYGEDGKATDLGGEAKKFFAGLKESAAQARKGFEDKSGFGVNIQEKQKPFVDEKEVKKYENMLQSIRRKVDPYNYAINQQKKEEEELMKLMKEKPELLKALGTSQSDLNNLLARSREHWTKQNDTVGNATEALMRQETVLAAHIDQRDALNARLSLEEQIKKRKGSVDDADLARLAEYTKRYQAYVDASKLDSYKENNRQQLLDLQDEINAIGLIGKQRERSIYLRQLERDSIRSTGSIQRDEITKLMVKYDELEQKYQQSRTYSQGFYEGVEDYMSRVRDLASTTRDAMSSVFSSLEDKLAEFIRTGKFSFKDFVSTINMELSKIAARQLIGLGMNLAGFRADGGPVTGGKTYVVGERGPELFTAPHSGTIIPNHQLATASRTTQSSGRSFNYSPVINISGNGVTMADVQSAMRQSESNIASWVTDEMRSGGILSR